MVVSEMDPYAKTGGLGVVAASLPAALAKQGVKVHLFLPHYACVQERRPQAQFREGVTVHFVDHPGYFQRSGLYGDRRGDYPDNLERFSFFCRRVLETLSAKGIAPNILHAHDWQAAMSVVYLKTLFKTEPCFAKTAAAMTIHNLAYQGIFPKESYPKLGIPWELFAIEGLEFYGAVNLLKGGIVFADAITTVSPGYAHEVQGIEQGAGLDGVLRSRANRLVGILNGIDDVSWDPAADRVLASGYDDRSLSKKKQNKAVLQEELGLPVSSKAFLIGMVTRLAAQKGFELLIEALPRFKALGLQLVILGSGDKGIEEALKKAVRRSNWMRVRFAFDEALSRRIYAGADAFLMPSLYEPCGLGQMIAMRYGTVPIVRATGGLRDTVADADSDKKMGKGFCFEPFTAGALTDAVERAMKTYKTPKLWTVLQQRGMSTDFSWDQSGKEYLRLYQRLCKGLR